MPLKIIAMLLITLFISNVNATQVQIGSAKTIKVAKETQLNSCSKEGERKCNTCFTGINSDPGGSHWVCLGGQWKPASADPNNCDRGKLCR